MAKYKAQRNKRKSDKFLRKHPEGRKAWSKEKRKLQAIKRHANTIRKKSNKISSVSAAMEDH